MEQFRLKRIRKIMEKYREDLIENGDEYEDDDDEENDENGNEKSSKKNGKKKKVVLKFKGGKNDDSEESEEGKLPEDFQGMNINKMWDALKSVYEKKHDDQTKGATPPEGIMDKEGEGSKNFAKAHTDTTVVPADANKAALFSAKAAKLTKKSPKRRGDKE